jgi:O-methyltransferase domain
MPPGFAVRLVVGLRGWLLRLADYLVPAEAAILDHTTAIARTALLGAVARHGVADYLEEHGPADAATIARALSLDADVTHRTLRALASMGIFTMSRHGVFTNSRLSRALRSGLLTRGREWALYFSSGSNAASWLDYARTLETGVSPFTRVHGKNVWDWFDEHPDERDIFAHCMMGLTVMDAPAIAALYPFGEVTRLCDVGGGRGTLLSEIVKRHRNVTGVLCDAAGLMESARELLAARGVEDRVELAPGSFFERVPSGCDAYILKNILHDWDDETCRTILRVVRAAMKPGQRVLVCEVLVDHNSRDSFGTRADLQMLVACENGRERSLPELQALLESTGFRFARVFHSPLVAVVEAAAL